MILSIGIVRASHDSCNNAECDRLGNVAERNEPVSFAQHRLFSPIVSRRTQAGAREHDENNENKKRRRVSYTT